ncbi:MAG TPA: MazG family protein [Rhabdochlamydiaceae bacterium]|nr:MazG family protein [Rhabdochlamydiaceae bacterium]
MNKFEDLLQVADTLQGPEGCPWDKKQTFTTLQPYILEEAHELLEAVDENDDQKIREELGDLLYTIIFYGKIAEKLGRFTIWDVIVQVKEKLIRRHPHVFGNLKVDSVQDVVKTWEKIKKEENKEKGRKHFLDGIPKTLPLLARTQKILQKMKRTKLPMPQAQEKIGDRLLALIAEAEEAGLDAETELRRSLSKLENAMGDKSVI